MRFFLRSTIIDTNVEDPHPFYADPDSYYYLMRIRMGIRILASKLMWIRIRFRIQLITLLRIRIFN
jgi:hypothetical protein